MNPLLTAHAISKSYGTLELFNDISFTILEGDRIGLLGPNGAGKSTLLKILQSIEFPDNGSITKKRNLKVGYAGQFPQFPDMPILEVAMQAYNDEVRAKKLLSMAQFEDITLIATRLSGGWKKRLDIVRALMQQPDIILLDEPTNHLDLEGIIWLEKFLAKERLTFVIVSHDRYFLENVCSKFIELNPCYPEGLFICEGDFGSYLETKELFLQGQLERERSLANKSREEVDWLRRSPKARTTKSRSRIQKAYALLDELQQVTSRNKVTRVSIDFSASERETKKLLTARNITKEVGGKILFKGVDITLSPGTRLGIVGKNGTGKTTLLKILSSQLASDMGTVKYAQDLQLVYFDQHREHIPDTVTLKEALSPTGDMVNYRGQYIHVNGWAKKFLFTPDRLTLPVKYLSGGERARILIAKLMLQPADILFLDEPTNDLDIQTLEVIEESLNAFTGAVVLITHDRCLMDRVCTEIIGLGEELEGQHFADYEQWDEACRKRGVKRVEPSKSIQPTQDKQEKKYKLSFKEQKEIDGMESAIYELEEDIKRLENQLESSEMQHDATKALDCYRLLADAQLQLERKFTRWQELLNKQQNYAQ